MNSVTAYALRLGDNGLVLSQRLGAWCGHAPELEIDLALANIGLDLLGQARNFLTYAAEREGQGDEDTLAFGRDERQFRNVLLVEQPNGSFADTIARQYLMDAWNVALYERLTQSRDAQLAAIAAKAIKEVRYHLRFSRGWLVRLGDGTETSAQRCSRPSTACGALRPSCLRPMTSSWRWWIPAWRLTRASCASRGKAKCMPV